MRILPIASLLAVLAVPASASAAYAPQLDVSIDPATPGAPTALTTTVTQASGETASKSVRLDIPAAFSPSSETRLTPCTDEQKAGRACPEESRMGQAVAETSLGTFAGTVNYGPIDAEGIRFFVFLSNGIPLLDQTLEGRIKLVETGFATVLEGLPDVATTSFRLALEGGERSLLNAPEECGTHTLRAAFTSHQDEQATSEASVDLAGCANRAPRIESLRARPRRREVRFEVTEAVDLSVKVRKRSGRVVRRVTTSGGPGLVKVKLPRVSRGRYSVLVTALDAEGAGTSRKVAYRVRR